MSYHTTNSLINLIKLKAMIPETQNTITESDFLYFLNEELSLSIVPLVMQFHEDYFLTTEIIPLVNNTLRYSIPSRAIGSKLNDLCFSPGDNTFQEMTRITVADLVDYGTNVRAFYLESGEVCLPPFSPLVNSNGSLKMSYYIRPNTLVAETNACIITGIDTINNIISVDSAPTIFTTAATYDITSSNAPFRLVGKDLVVTQVPSSTSLQFTLSSLPTNIQIGDVISISGYTTIPQVPSELHALLAQRVTMRCLEALGDTQGLQNATAKLQDMEQKISYILDNRVESAPIKIAPKNTLLRRKNYNYRR